MTEDINFPTDYDGTPEQWVKENFPRLNIRDREAVVEKYILFLLDQNEPEDESGEDRDLSS